MGNWKTMYCSDSIENEDLIGNIYREDVGQNTNDDDSTWEIIFDFDNERYYCYVDALNINEALGMFFKLHYNVTYNDIVDHFEV